MVDREKKKKQNKTKLQPIQPLPHKQTNKQNQSKINNPQSKALGFHCHSVNPLKFLTYQNFVSAV